MSTSRRWFLQSAGCAAAVYAGRLYGDTGAPLKPLDEFGYGSVVLRPGLAQKQFEETQNVLLGLNEDSLLKPFRLRAGLPAPGPDMGGWYDETPLDKTESGGHGFAPAHSFGQWISALARGYAVNRDPRVRAKLDRLLALYEPAISPRFYKNFRFPTYVYDKMVCGLIDAHEFGERPQAFRLLDLTTNAAIQHLPPHALDRDEQREWRRSVGDNTADDYTWDESYTMPENLYLAWERGAGERYKEMAGHYLLDERYFDPLSEGRNVLPHHHAYSFCNALSSAAQAYLATGSMKHLRAASNAFDMIIGTQSFATGGWGPNERFVEPGTGALYKSLTNTHKSFETPCGSYAHFKLTRYLLRVTRDGKYGDSMERVLYNTVLGAKSLEPDGRAFYYSDYNFGGTKVYFPDAWPCCSGTLPQVAADYRKLIYFHDGDGVFVNLYLPSELHWTEPGGAKATISQTGDYPLGGNVAMRLELSHPAAFRLHLRIPAWCSARGVTLHVNRKPTPVGVDLGFALLERRWSNGDRIDLQFAMTTRLEPVDDQHPNVVALLRGALALLPLGEQVPTITKDEFRSAERVLNEPEWRLKTRDGELKLRPFFAIANERYTTYIQTI